jgi:hypothetical protein
VRGIPSFDHLDWTQGSSPSRQQFLFDLKPPDPPLLGEEMLYRFDINQIWIGRQLGQSSEDAGHEEATNGICKQYSGRYC